LTALDSLASVGPVVAVAGPRTQSLGGRVWVVPVAGLEVLAGAVRSATAHLDTSGDTRPFRGHLTLARARRPGGLKGLRAAPLSMEWEVGEIVAVESELRSTGAVHEVLAAWPVRSP
jgi:2'-5' RNA ligase